MMPSKCFGTSVALTPLSFCFLAPLDIASGDRDSSGGPNATRWALPETEPRPVPEIVDALRDQIAKLDRLVKGKSRATLEQADNDGLWGVVDVLSHLRDWEHVAHDRVHRIVENDDPVLPDYDDSLWSVEHHYRANDPFAVLDELKSLRQDLIEWLEPLDDDAWHRTAILEGTGPLTLRKLLHMLCDHDHKHLEQARFILA